jgi:hypothetical protein
MVRVILLVGATLSVGALATMGASAKPGRVARRPVRAATRPAPSAAVSASPLPGGMMTPKDVILRPMTAAEAEANAIWSTRAGLNIAALQCQYSPFLATVRNWNDFLRQHSEELEVAVATMTAHFKRYDGTRAQNSFDHYTTQTYNSYSTLDAQFTFCEEAGRAGRVALTLPKATLGGRAGSLRDQMRAALIPVSPLALLKAVPLVPETLPEL